jgi:hypothetical protein
MRNLKNEIKWVAIASIFIMSLKLSYANTALNQASEAIKDPAKVFDGSSFKGSIDVPQVPPPTPAIDNGQSLSQTPQSQNPSVNIPPANPKPDTQNTNPKPQNNNNTNTNTSSSVNQSTSTTQKPPTFIEKVGMDIKDNKWDYTTEAIAGGFAGYMIGGPIGILIGVVVLLGIIIIARADYIDKKYNKK